MHSYMQKSPSGDIENALSRKFEHLLLRAYDHNNRERARYSKERNEQQQQKKRKQIMSHIQHDYIISPCV